MQVTAITHLEILTQWGLKEFCEFQGFIFAV